MVAVCAKSACVKPFSADTCRTHEEYRRSTPQAVLEAPYVSWNHILKQGYWCMPACILEDQIHPKMNTNSALSTAQKICEQYAIHGRCGIDFHP